MDVSEDFSPQELKAGLQKIRRRRWFLWIMILVYLPAMMFALRSPDAGHAVVTVFIIWILLLIVAVALMDLVRCPQCGNCFHMSGFLFRPVRKCFHCGLHLTADRKN